MTLAAGARLGLYEIVAPLGAGGMGEVYRARDTKLGRDVAIKVLPSSFATDPDRLARFEREARLLASLNHPNIGAIYGVEETSGVVALVLERVDGETLAERIGKGSGLRAHARNRLKRVALSSAAGCRSSKSPLTTGTRPGPHEIARSAADAVRQGESWSESPRADRACGERCTTAECISSRDCLRGRRPCS